MRQALIVFALAMMLTGCTRVVVPVNLLPYMLIENPEPTLGEQSAPAPQIAQSYENNETAQRPTDELTK